MSEISNKQGYMGSVTVGDKGQIVIPKQVRDMFGIKPGDTLLLLADFKQGIAIPKIEDCNAIRQEIFRKIQEKENDNGSDKN